MKSILIKDLTHCLTLIGTVFKVFSAVYKPPLNKVKISKIRKYLCTLYFLIKAMYKYIRVCSRRKSATSSKGVRFPIFLVLKLHVSMRTNKKHDPPCYILHLQWIGIPFEEVFICTSIFTRKCLNVYFGNGVFGNVYLSAGQH